MRNLSAAVLLVAWILTPLGPLAAAESDSKPAAGGTPIFNGRDLTGWKTKKGESLDGKTESPDGRFKVVDGNLVIDAKVKGDVIIQTAQEFSGDVHLAFEFLPGAGCNNDLFFRGTKFDIKAKDVQNLEVDKWHEFEIVVTGDKAEFKCNGKSQRTLPTKADKSPLGLRAEAGPIMYRNLRVK